LVINTSTTIVTFLMVFLIQHTQNRDTLSLQLKLSELIISMQGAENRLAAVEDLSEEELEHLHADYRRRADKRYSAGQQCVGGEQNEQPKQQDGGRQKPEDAEQERAKALEREHPPNAGNDLVHHQVPLDLTKPGAAQGLPEARN